MINTFAQFTAVDCAPIGGNVLRTKMKIAFSGGSAMRLRITYTNCPTLRSAGTRYLHHRQNIHMAIDAMRVQVQI